MIKILIADDEKVECDALEKMIRCHFTDMQLLPSVYDGLSLVKSVNELRPDIVIVDINMPGLNGLDALEILRGGNPEMEILLHTAYSEFEYVHRALKLGSADYLVKPVFEETFLEVFRPVVQKVEKRQMEAKKKPVKFWSEDLKTATEWNIMMGLLQGKPDRQSWEWYRAQYWAESVRVAGESDGENAYIFSVYFEPCANRGMYYEMFGRELQKTQNLMSCVYQDTLYCLIWGDDVGTISRKTGRFAVAHDMLYRAGISSVRQSFLELPAAFGESDIARRGAAENTCAFYRSAELTLRPDKFVLWGESLAKLLIKGDSESAGQMVRERMEESFPDKVVSFADCYYAQHMIANVAEALKLDLRRTGLSWKLPTLVAALAGTPENPGIWSQKDDPDRLTQSVPAELLLALLQRELGQMESDLGRAVRTENSYVSKAFHFIHQHYMEEISLEQTASAVGISQFYLSRLLKQERNQTFLEAITQERISASLQYMTDPTRSIQSICDAIGYSVKYFYQIFRNVTGFSQKEFRDALLL